MIEAAAANGWIDRRRAIDESVLGIRRAGADAVLTYWAVELAGWLRPAMSDASMTTAADVDTANADLFARARQPSPAASTRRCAPSARSAARRASSSRPAAPYVTDADGREYVDLVGSWGPAILGHAHPEVVRAVQDAAAAACRSAHPRRARPNWRSWCAAGRVAAAGREAAPGLHRHRGDHDRDPPCARRDRARPARQVRRALPRPLRCAARRAGSGVATLALPGSAGVTAATAAQTLVLPYNDLDAVRAAFAAHGPTSRPSSSRRPPRTWASCRRPPGFNAPGRDRARARRAAHPRRGAHRVPRRARRMVGARGAVGGRLAARPLHVRQGHRRRHAARRARRPRRPHGPARPARPGLPGGHAERQPGRRRRRDRHAAARRRRCVSPDERRRRAISDAVSTRSPRRASPHSIQRAGNLFSVAFAETPPRDYAAVKRQEAFRYPPFFHAMLDAGVCLPPSVFEAWFVTAAHDDAAVVAHPGRAARCREGRRRGQPEPVARAQHPAHEIQENYVLWRLRVRCFHGTMPATPAFRTNDAHHRRASSRGDRRRSIDDDPRCRFRARGLAVPTSLYSGKTTMLAFGKVQRRTNKEAPCVT